MGLLSNLKAEAEALDRHQTTIPVGKNPNRNSPTSLEVPVHPGQLPAEDTEAVKVDFRVQRNIVEKATCPTCRAEAGRNHYDAACKNTQGKTDWKTVHKERIRIYLTIYGITEDQMSVMPYREFPNADNFSMWGTFNVSSSGLEYGAKPTASFSTYEAAAAAEKARNDYLKTQEGRKDSRAKRLKVFPMVWRAGKYHRYDKLPVLPDKKS